VGLGGVALVVVVLLVLWIRNDDSAPSSAPGEQSTRSSEAVLASPTHGPLCDALPLVDDPGGPEAIASLTADEALTWIPVLTRFEAATRAAGLTEELRNTEGVTILAPTDDAFARTLSDETWDSLILFRQDELRMLLDSHLVEPAMSVDELVRAGTVTALGGDVLSSEAAGAEVRLGGRATAVCADYRVANATIHVIDQVLGELPPPAPPEDPSSG
jgi:hypothetical protein